MRGEGAGDRAFPDRGGALRQSDRRAQAEGDHPLVQRLTKKLTFESVSAHRALRGVPRSGLWSEGEIAASGTGSERAQDRERSGEEALREPVLGMAACPRLSRRRIGASSYLRDGTLTAKTKGQRPTGEGGAGARWRMELA